MRLHEDVTNTRKILRFETLEQDFNRKHSNKFDYSKAVYTGIKDMITIICPVHGEFRQTADSHLYQGCEKCGVMARADTCRGNTDDFIKKANIVHNGKYRYTKTDYHMTHDKVIITCPIHGDMEQTPHNHLAGKGCLSCAKENKWLDIPTHLYYIKIIKKGKVYYKIGITTKDILKGRFAKDSKHYELTIINSKLFTSGNLAYRYEQQILSDFKECQTKDTPLKGGGNSEIFDIDIYESIEQYFK